jgi:hypothetical protein
LDMVVDPRGNADGSCLKSWRRGRKRGRAVALIVVRLPRRAYSVLQDRCNLIEPSLILGFGSQSVRPEIDFFIALV